MRPYLSISLCAFICNAFEAYLNDVIQEQNIGDSSGYIASNLVISPQTNNFVLRAKDIAVVVETLFKKKHTLALSTYAGFHAACMYCNYAQKNKIHM